MWNFSKFLLDEMFNRFNMEWDLHEQVGSNWIEMGHDGKLAKSRPTNNSELAA